MDVIAKRRLHLTHDFRKRNPRQLFKFALCAWHQKRVNHVVETVVKNKILVRRLVEKLLRHRLESGLLLNFSSDLRDVVLRVVNREHAASIFVRGESDGVGDKRRDRLALDVALVPSLFPLRRLDDAQERVSLALNPLALKRKAEFPELRIELVPKRRFACHLPQMEEAMSPTR